MIIRNADRSVTGRVGVVAVLDLPLMKSVVRPAPLVLWVCACLAVGACRMRQSPAIPQPAVASPSASADGAAPEAAAAPAPAPSAVPVSCRPERAQPIT